MNSTGSTKQIRVSGDPHGELHGSLFRALSQLYPVEFQAVEPGDQPTPDALIVLDGDVKTGTTAAAAGIPAFVVSPGNNPRREIPGRCLRFGTSARIEPCLRNQTMIDSENTCAPLSEEHGDEVLAFVENQPVWLSRPTARATCELVSIAPPRLRQGEFLFQHLNGRRFMGLLPLMQFLRKQVKGIDWEESPSRACFVFDDPSLHWHSYGFLNYRQLAEHAEAHNYFASVATIPLDTWWVNTRVATILRASSPRLSVLIHGNDHTVDEMLSPCSAAERRSRLAQAMHRMERLRRKHGIPIVNVMEAPYGAFAENLLDDLLVLGYEAALCTTALLVQHNPRAAWPAAFGLDRSDLLGGGLPVLPRIRMSSDWKNDVLLAAFLRQPVIVSGHHFDAAHELEFLADLACTVNGLDGVTWSDLPGILRANYRQRIEGDLLTVKLFSRNVVVSIPPGTRSLRVERSWIPQGHTERLTISTDVSGAATTAAERLSGTFAVGGGREARIVSEIENPLHFSTVTMPRPNPWPIARKIMMEVRDRLSPAIPFIERLHRTAHPRRP
jgi:hypothetical protein